MNKAVVTATIDFEWDLDEYRQDVEDPNLTDEQILEEVIGWVEEDWGFWSRTASSPEVDGYLQ